MIKINDLYATVRYKRNSDDNANTDPIVKLVVNKRAQLTYFSPSFLDSRDMGSNNLISSVDPDFIIYDPEYENKNDGKARFDKLFAFRTHYGNTNVYYHDKLTNRVIAVKFVTGLDPKLFPKKVFTLPITIFVSPNLITDDNTNNLAAPQEEIDFIFVPKDNATSTINTVSLIIKGDKASSVETNVRCHLNNDYGATSNIMASSYVKYPMSSVDVDNSDFSYAVVYEYDKYRDNTAFTNDLNNIDYIYFPLDI